MLVLYILAALIGIVLLLLFCSVSICAFVDDDFLLSIRFLFFKFNFPNEKSKHKQKSKKTKQKEDTLPVEKKNPVKKMIEDKGFVTAVSEIMSIVKSVLNEFDKLLKHVRFRRFNLFINVANQDPALTAVEYGAVCAAVFPVVRIIEAKTQLDRKSTEVLVESDFVTAKSKIKFDVKVKFRLVFGVLAAINVLIQLVKLKLKQKDVK